MITLESQSADSSKATAPPAQRDLALYSLGFTPVKNTLYICDFIADALGEQQTTKGDVGTRRQVVRNNLGGTFVRLVELTEGFMVH